MLKSSSRAVSLFPRFAWCLVAGVGIGLGVAACGKSDAPASANAPAPAAVASAPSAAPAAPAQDANDPTSKAGTTWVPGQTPEPTTPGAAAAANGIGGADATPAGPVTPLPKIEAFKFTPALAAEGKKLFFSSGCNACHGGTGGGGMCPPLTNKVWVYGNDVDTLHALIKEGTLGMAGHGLTRIGHENVVGQMPPFGTVLKDDQINELIAFIHSLNPTLGDPAAAPKKM